MNKYKQGFSIAELLMCFAIIGIVSAMGMTLTKQNMEKVYRSYWQTGYNNLRIAIHEIPHDQDEDQRTVNQTNLIRKCNELFNDDTNTDSGTVETGNGISYTITENNNNNSQIHIVMTVPQPKTRQNSNGNASTELLYDNTSGLLIPLPSGYMEDGTRTDLSDNRLLQFYIDDGKSGRRRIDSIRVDNTQLQPRTFANAFCNSGQFSNNNITYGGASLDTAFSCNDNDKHNTPGILVPVTKY